MTREVTFFRWPIVSLSHSRHLAEGLLKLCIRTLRGRSLRHPSFVAVLHHSFSEISYTSTVPHKISDVPTCIIAEARLHVFTAQFLYSRIIVKTRIKAQFFFSYYCKCYQSPPKSKILRVGSKHLLRYKPFQLDAKP